MTWFLANIPTILGYLTAHLAQALPAVVATLVLALPLARLAQHTVLLRRLLVGGSSLLYAVPSLPLLIILPLILGTGVRSVVNVVVALTLYGLAIMVPAAVDALDAVDPRVLDAATAMGVGPVRRFLTVELALAGPAVLTGLRVVCVSTISLTTVGAVLGVRSLGWLFTDGFQRGIQAEVLVGILLTAAVALVLDLLVLGAGRVLMPWTVAGAATGAAGEDASAAAADVIGSRGGETAPRAPGGAGVQS
ncbi:ABC transporter permease subunit [Actinomyces sp. 2119]|uniref:ABC transporter permease subunit n=1 Tax=Actinomyces lilanjuaniae TaxID=2321394 RepID=A0ABM6Z4L4_9ACTO|nr:MULTISPECIES: ABC transporter permease subunit [Actinomyces]AYD90130.1 ABC transporter permease subunit [Actinomyces lilanjuaniae]RJF41380.1 ABC transporter permease subunit [Actinomyces sp. 2119]